MRPALDAREGESMRLRDAVVVASMTALVVKDGMTGWVLVATTPDVALSEHDREESGLLFQFERTRNACLDMVGDGFVAALVLNKALQFLEPCHAQTEGNEW